MTSHALALPADGTGPRVSAWSPYGEWILYWETFGLSESLNADGGPLKAIPASGGEPTTVVEAMLFYPDFVTWCGDTLVAAAGGGREVTVDKHLVAASPPDWTASSIESPPGISVFWPDCSPDGDWVAATATRCRPEATAGTLRRTVVVFSISDPSSRVPLTSEGPNPSAEFPRWSENDSRSGEVILFVTRSKNPDGPAYLYLEQGPGIPQARSPRSAPSPATSVRTSTAACSIGINPKPGSAGNRRPRALVSSMTDW